MSRIRADRIVDRAAAGAPLFPNGVVVTGVATATTFDGNATTATSATSATSATNAQGLTGTPDITINNLVGVAATFTGVLTYEDVTNVDSVGIVTAQTGVRVNTGGIVVTAGISTIGAGLSLTGPYKENITAMGALEVDCSAGNYFTKTITTGTNIFTFSNVPTGCAYSFTVELTHQGGTAQWPATVKFPGNNAPSLTDGKATLFMFSTNDGGVTFRGSTLIDYDN